VSGALSVGVASALMGLTKTIHPPAGATALLCSTEPSIIALGWLFLPMIILGTTLLLAVALILNNIQRQFPVYWWTPLNLKPPAAKEDVEKAASGRGDRTEGASASCSSGPKFPDQDLIQIDKEQITVPDWMALDDEERGALEILQAKLKVGRGED
jgi:HPP family